jgi:tetratricopeptide (TPR) repeat protein
VIEADRAWYEGDQLRYEKNGGVYGLPKSLVKSLDQQAAPVAGQDPDITKGRERLSAGAPLEAVRLFQVVLSRDPKSIEALQGLAEAQLALGDKASAREAAARAVQLDGRNARSRILLGDALTGLGDRAGAEAEYRRSLLLRPDPAVQRKVSELATSVSSKQARAQFRIRYDGGVNEPLGLVVLEVLSGAYEDFSRRLGFRPDDPITVVLELGTEIHDTRVPEWAAGVNDGTIHVPLRGLDRPTPRLIAVLRHELAHSFISARTGGNCPAWLQEGIAMWLEGGDPHREDALVGQAVRERRLLPLLTLEAPFQSMPAADLALAYAESLSAVAHIIDLRGQGAVVRLLAGLGDRLPSEEALPAALALSYPEFQASWEARVTGRAAPATPR